MSTFDTPTERRDFFDTVSRGAPERAAALFEALRGAPADAIRTFLAESGINVKAPRLHAGTEGSTLWAEGSARSSGGGDVVVEFPPEAIQLSRLLAVVLSAGSAGSSEGPA